MTENAEQPVTGPKEPPETLGEALRAERLRQGLSQLDMARMLDVPQQSYYRWESDQALPRDRRMFPRMAGFLGMPLLDVLALAYIQRGLPEEELNRRIEEVKQFMDTEQLDPPNTDFFNRTIEDPRENSPADKLANIEAILEDVVHTNGRFQGMLEEVREAQERLERMQTEMRQLRAEELESVHNELRALRDAIMHGPTSDPPTSTASAQGAPDASKGS